jgi:hypothetical protein
MENTENTENILFDENIHDYVDTYLEGPEYFDGSGYKSSTNTTKYYSHDKFTVGKIYKFGGADYDYYCTFEILEILGINDSDVAYFKYIILFTTNKETKRQPGYRRMFITGSDFYEFSFPLEDQDIP